jgi:NADH-quinone oxidoreductase subunit A
MAILAYSPFAPILILIVMVIAIATITMVLAHVIGPRRHGTTKDSTYESGMPPIGDARRRFNVKFYLVAMLFLLFDVEVLFMWPWAQLFYDTASPHPTPVAEQMVLSGYGKEFLLGAMAVFGGFLLVGFIYEWKKGIFRWA